jgi:PfaD family protein
MLGKAGIADFIMAPSADMFEMGVSVQVLRRGTLFAQRASRLYAIYRQYQSIGAIPADLRQGLEQDVFRASLDEIWASTRRYLEATSSELLARADVDPRARMALIFRWYLGLSSRWPIEGAAERIQDYQLWAGPGLAACNDWVAGSFLEDARTRSAIQLALNILEGAATLTRAHQLRVIGVPIPTDAFRFVPRPLA